MTPVKSADDLAVGDAVEVREHYSYGSEPPRRRGTAVRVGKAAAVIAFANSQETTRYVKRVTVEGGGSRGRSKSRRDFHPLSVLSPRDIWIAESPTTDRVWGGGSTSPTVIARAMAVRDEIDAVIEDLRKYSAWLQREPKEEAQ